MNACFGSRTSNGTNIRHLVRQYALHCRSRSREELQFFASQPSLAMTVEAAALATDSGGKRDPHQRRRSRDTLSAARGALLSGLEELRRCRDFHQLLETVDRLVQNIPDLGELYSYDTALHIGAKQGLMPERVYLHAGTREGARALGLPYREQAIELWQLPTELRRLAPHEIEDFLCIFKSRLTKITVGRVELAASRRLSSSSVNRL